jgi:hypothetical protein
MTPSQEVNEAVGAAEDVSGEIAQLRAELSQPSERERKQQRLRELEARAVAKRESAARAKAVERQKGIKRAHGSLVDQLEQDERKLIAGVDAVIELICIFNKRYSDGLISIEREDAALADRFGLLPSKLTPVDGPARRTAVIKAMERLYAGALVERSTSRPAIETDDSGLRQRRTYQEIAGSEGHAIIFEAGLKDFPPLTERQCELLAERDRDAATRAERAQAQSDFLASEAARTVPAIAGHPGRPFSP